MKWCPVYFKHLYLYLHFSAGAIHTATGMFSELEGEDGRRRVLLILTDGLSNDREQTIEKAYQLKKTTEIYTLGEHQKEC